MYDFNKGYKNLKRNSDVRTYYIYRVDALSKPSSNLIIYELRESDRFIY